MDADDVRALARTAPERWERLHFVHTGGPAGRVEAWLRHGEAEVRDEAGRVHRLSGSTPTSWTVRDIEPIWQSYDWAAMLDPYELGEHVEIDRVRLTEVAGRPAVSFRAQAQEGYDPICSCCPLVPGEVAWRLEHGDSREPERPLPEHVELTLDRLTGIVVRQGPPYGFEVELLEAT